MSGQINRTRAILKKQKALSPWKNWRTCEDVISPYKRHHEVDPKQYQ
tara:strand:- start:63 stop:203 length:141 start_codon:yes stop_codon:yes gene_type:complete